MITKVNLIFIVAILIFCNLANADELPKYIRAESKQSLTTENSHIHRHKLNTTQVYGEVEKRNYDVLRYDLHLDLSHALSASLEDSRYMRKTFSGAMLIVIQLLDDTKKIEFDAENMEIVDIVYINHDGNPDISKAEYNYDDGLISINVPAKFKPNDTGTFIISYKSEADDFPNFRNNRGMHIYHKGYNIGDEDINGNPVVTEHNIAYSMSEPELARYWMPCNDRPYDKALSSIAILVPKGYTAVANGNLTVIDDTLFENRVLYKCDNTEPITTYLMNFAASIFDEYEQEAVLDNQTVKMLHYAWSEDMSGDYFKLIPSMKTHPLMMDILVDKYGEYPFSRYGTVTVYPFPYGGMEHQTNVTQNRFWIRDNGDGGFVHEMGHHWFGDAITCATWADIWINEGGATFTEALYFGEVYGQDRFRSVMDSKIKWYLFNNPQNTAKPLYAVPLNTFFGDDGYLIYEKGAVINNQLRINVGDEQYYSILKEIFEEYRYESITTAQYQEAWESKAKNPLVDIDLFFEQWVYGAGHPEYILSSVVNEVESGKFVTKIKVTQNQMNNPVAHEKVPDLFVTPISFILSDDDNEAYSEVYMNDEMVQEFEVETDFAPDDIKVDRLTVAHTDLTNFISSVTIEDYFGEIGIFPNPAISGIAQLKMNILQSVRTAQVELIDILGNELRQLYNGPMKDGGISININTSDLTAGIYFVNINLDGAATTKKLVVQQ